MRVFFVGAFAFLFCSGAALKSQDRLTSFQDHFQSSSLGPVQTLESQHFRVLWVHPRDEVLAEPLLQHMESARTLLVEIFGEAAIHPDRKAGIEIFPDLPSFSAVSGLSLARFRATGTIALTLEQRLMILSPRNLLNGYSWAETAVHEYIHYLIREISPEHIPIWLHEGVAQLFQAFPASTSPELRPSQWGLFKRRRDQLKLLDLRTLREPFPYRETPEEAELAYVQSLLFAKWLNEKCGVLSLIRGAHRYQSIDRAMEACVGEPLQKIESGFLTQIMGGVQVPEGGVVEFYARDFSSRDPLEREGQALSQQAQNLAQLSSEIFRQGRYRASAIEMQRALDLAVVSPPSWRRQMAEAFLRSQPTEELSYDPRSSAQSVLRDLLRDYPDDAAAWFLLGQQYQQASRPAEAWRSFVNAFFRNPFLEGLMDQMQNLRSTQPELTQEFQYEIRRP